MTNDPPSVLWCCWCWKCCPQSDRQCVEWVAKPSSTHNVTVVSWFTCVQLCQSKPECGRQMLTELLIRPVQRLPSIMLLLKGVYCVVQQPCVVVDNSKW